MLQTNATTTPRALPAPGAHQRTACGDCTRLEPLDDGVGWCPAHGQYRATSMPRLCPEFRSLTTTEV